MSDLYLYQELCAEYLSKDRLAHVYRVSDTAKKLANMYNIDAASATSAGMLHDIAKHLSPQKCHSAGISLFKGSDLLFEQYPPVWHAFAAESVLAHHGITLSEDVTLAIQYHTTGFKSMTVLQEIIYVSDFIEPGRDFPMASLVRELVKTQPLKACVLAIVFSTIHSLLKKSLPIHPFTFECYNSYVKKLEPGNRNKILESVYAVLQQ